MRSPARAFGWEFRRHLWPLAGVAVYLPVMEKLRTAILGPGPPIRLDPPDGMAALAIVPFSTTFLYFLAAFSFGFSGDLAARQSIYPARKFTLPVSTAALAGWPMFYGAAAMLSLWTITAFFGWWSWGISVPWIWPGLLIAVFLGWTQALTWMPYPLPGLRVIVTVLWLASLDAIILLAAHFHVGEPWMIAFLAPQLPLAYVAAVAAVGRARRGETPDWGGAFARIRRRPAAAQATPGGRKLLSPARAQSWLEWRQHGLTLPALVAILLPCELALLFVAGNELVLAGLLAALCTPPFMAFFVAATFSKPNPQAREAHGLSPFAATRPLATAALIAAKLKMAIWSTLAAWLLVLAAIPLGLLLSGTWPYLIEKAKEAGDAVGTPRAIVLLLLGISLLVAATWNQLVQSLCIGLSGRPWLVRASAAFALAFLVVIVPIGQYLHDHGSAVARLWDALPFFLWVLAGLKISAAAFVATRLHRGRLLGDRLLVQGAAYWLAAVLALYALLVWLAATPLIPGYVLLLLAILAIPLARLAAAPLALAANRHRR